MADFFAAPAQADDTTLTASGSVLSVKGPVLVCTRGTTTGTPAAGTVIASLAAAAGNQLVDVQYAGTISSAGTGNPDYTVTLTWSDATTTDLALNQGGSGQLDIWGSLVQAGSSRTSGSVVCVQVGASIAGKKCTQIDVKVRDADLANSRTWTAVIIARETKL